MSYCAPNIDIKTHYTCFSLDELIEIAKAFNEYIKKNKVCLGDSCIPRKYIDYKSKNRKELWWSIYVRLKPICQYEYCWIDLKFIRNIKDSVLREKIRYFTFKPKMTKKRYSWLSTTDINDVMEQYQEYDKAFKFLGALPSNFYKVQRMNYDRILNYKKFAIIFNHDNHDEKGSHWVVLLVDNELNTIEYFDSAGDEPNENIKKFIKNVYEFLSKRNLEYKYKQNKSIHQKENTECGVYSLYYIIQRLLGYTFEDITHNIISDEEMNHFRGVIFRPRSGANDPNTT